MINLKENLWIPLEAICSKSDGAGVECMRIRDGASKSDNHISGSVATDKMGVSIYGLSFWNKNQGLLAYVSLNLSVIPFG